ncbi:MAG: HNH endonuclease signature motif containing protein [Bacteroidales bacterium]
MLFYNNYEVFENGSVYSHKSGKFLKRSTGPTGYVYCQGSVNGKKVYLKPHRLVAIAFIPNPDNLKEVNHKDLDKSNCDVTNLEWCTRSENIQHSYLMGARSATGVNNARCVTEEGVVIQICEYLVAGLSASQIRDLGFKYSLVRKIKSKENWSHISDNYSW